MMDGIHDEQREIGTETMIRGLRPSSLIGLLQARRSGSAAARRIT